MKRRMSFDEYKEHGGIMSRQEFDRQEVMAIEYDKKLHVQIDFDIFVNKAIKSEQKQLIQQGGY